ncbi:MAG: cytochrome c1 [Ectothiorhodospiraceae bacterium]|nr:cytochrome c1 [Ectothiorhodospiraceae bacterium]
MNVLSLLMLLLVMLMPSSWAAASSGVKLDEANIQIEDRDAIKRGAKLFVQYCLNCHSAELMRYSRIGQDLGMTKEEVRRDLITTGAKPGGVMTVAIDKEDATRWFGKAPPDLSVISRARGVDWLYTYLRSFYRDTSRPWGVNNTVFKDVGMPHVLWELQGLQAPVIESIVDINGNTQEHIVGFTLVQKGQMDAQTYDDTVRDLVTFLDYLGEPSKLQRLALGKWVLLFLAGLLVLVILLKKEYWRDIH